MKEAAAILANAGVGLIDLKFGVLVPMLPVQSQDIERALLERIVEVEG